MDEKLDAILIETRAVRRLLETLVITLAPEETPAEQSLLAALQELTQTVDDTGGVVSAMHSVVSRLAPAQPSYEPA